MSEKIDFVLTWVNGEDPAWLKVKQSYEVTNAYGDQKERYRNWELLRFWFRGVEQYADWVGTIYLVTWGHVPAWLNLEHPKIKVVRHEEILPPEMLPTFNSSLLELYVHRIPGLSEHFVLFNDDVFLLKKIKPDFFFKKGKPCDMLALQPVIANPANPGMSHVFLNNMLVLSKYFSKRECAKKHPGHFFCLSYPPLYFWYNVLEMVFPQLTGFYTVHGAAPYCKKTFQEIWEKEGEYLLSLSANRFRADSDVNQYLLREWQKLSGNFYPVNATKGFRYYEITDDNSKLCKDILNGKASMVCVNDTGRVQNVDTVKEQLIAAFEKRLPKPCSYEK